MKFKGMQFSMSFFPFFQIFERAMPEVSSELDSEDNVAAFLLITGVSNLLKDCFNSLKEYDDWKHFFLFLLRAVHVLPEASEGFTTATGRSLLPSPGDIVGVCRILFQTVVSVRLCMADGQHRVQAMLSVLTAQMLYRSSTASPPRYFQRNPEDGSQLYHGGLNSRAEWLFEYCSEMFSPPVTVFLCFLNKGTTWAQKTYEDAVRDVSLNREQAAKKKNKYGEANV